MADDRIYLDNAATSWPKPEAVYLAVDHYLRQLGAPAGRGAYEEALTVDRLISDTRQALANLVGVNAPHNVVFALNGTDALHLGLQGCLADLRKSGKTHVITSDAEHNSVLRPLRAWQDAGDVEVSHVPVDASGFIDPGAVRDSLRVETGLIVLAHASNVTGTIQPIEEVGRIAQERDLLFLVDAAQTLGEVPLRLESLGASMLAAPGHKGLLGPLGTGVLMVRPGLEKRLTPVRWGGTGTASDDERHPATMPEMLEAGNLNVPGIAGLKGALDWFQQQAASSFEAVDQARQQQVRLTAQLLAGLRSIEGVTVLGTETAEGRVGIVSFTVAGYDPQEFARVLDSAFRIQARPGLHCAPRMHRALGTIASGGTVRLSLGHFTTAKQIDAAIHAVEQIATAPALD